MRFHPLSDFRKGTLRFGNFGFQPDGRKAVHPRQSRACRDSHAFSHVEALDHAVKRRRYRHDWMGLARFFDSGDQVIRHAEKFQARFRCRCEIAVFRPEHGEVFGLRPRPFRHQQVYDRRAPRNHIPWCPGIDSFDKTCASCLQDRHIAVVENHIGCRV